MNPDQQKRYAGCLSTSPLWRGRHLAGLVQFKLTEARADEVALPNELPRRLGKLVEQFIFHTIKSRKDVRWLGDNLQINATNKRTVGELDALFYQAEQLVHLEVAYKFYLYDPRVDDADPLAHWIGPNRKDRLVDKLAKLKERQFPLLFHPLAREMLAAEQIDLAGVSQQMCFKAQLFLPFDEPELAISPLNDECVAGSYWPFDRLEELGDHTFYFPVKPDWLVVPHLAVEWMSYDVARALIEKMINQERSPMIWLKDGVGKLRKGFVVFW